MSRPFSTSSRVLHWLMAVLILAMLLIGVGMVASVSPRYEFLVAIHRPLGIAILLLVVVRLFNRMRHRPPPLPDDLAPILKLAAHASHIVLYALMFLLPLVGWAMLSAADYPIPMFAGIQLPPILMPNPTVAASLRSLHTVLAYALFATFLAHLGAALFHAWVRRDGVFESMAGK